MTKPIIIKVAPNSNKYKTIITHKFNTIELHEKYIVQHIMYECDEGDGNEYEVKEHRHYNLRNTFPRAALVNVMMFFSNDIDQYFVSMEFAGSNEQVTMTFLNATDAKKQHDIIQEYFLKGL